MTHQEIEQALQNLQREQRYAHAVTLIEREYGPRIAGYLAVRMPKRALREEAYVRTLECAWRGFHRFEFRGSLEGWLKKTANRVMQRIYDEENKLHHRSNDGVAPGSLTPPHWDGLTNRKRLERYIQNLKEPRVRAMVKEIARGMTYQEAADHFGYQTPNACRKAYERAGRLMLEMRLMSDAR